MSILITNHFNMLCLAPEFIRGFFIIKRFVCFIKTGVFKQKRRVKKFYNKLNIFIDKLNILIKMT